MKGKAAVPSEEVVDPVLRIKIGDRVFLQDQNLSFEQDMYLMSLAVEAGLGPDALKGIDVRKDAQKLVVDAYRSGKMFLIVGTALKEAGTEMQPWSEETAKKNADLFATCTDKVAKQQLQQVMVGLLLGFTLGDEESLANFRKSFAANKQ